MAETETPSIPISENPDITSQEPTIDMEAFHPLNYPSLALQTYESFGADPNRARSKVDFALGRSVHLKMEYPKLVDAEYFDAAETELKDRLELALTTFGEDSVTVSSIRYRLEEVEFLRVSQRLNNPDLVEERQANAEKFVELSEKLYGKPDHELANSMLGTAKRNSNLADPRIAALWGEIENGFSTTLWCGEVVEVGAVVVPDEFEELPSLSPEAVEMLHKEWKLFRGALVEAQALVQDIIAAEKGSGIDYDKNEVVFSGKRLHDVFVLGAIGLAEILGIDKFSVILDPNGSSASWESKDQAIVVGANRSASMGANSRVTGTTPHESMHAVKSVNGAKSGEPALSTGVFTKDENGNWICYLDYEEGNNKIGEFVLSDEDIPETMQHDYVYSVVSSLAYKGFDDRQISEVMKKLVLIEKLSKNPDIEVHVAEAEIAEDVTARIERVFRGTPCDPQLRVNGNMPIFTKDTAYNRGYYSKAVPYWNEVAKWAIATEDPQAALHQEFVRQNKGKADFSDPGQSALIAA
jgi:hypothetical protein